MFMSESPTSLQNRVMIADLSSAPVNPGAVFVDCDSEYKLLLRDAERLYSEAELVFVELLTIKGVLKGDNDEERRQDYLQRFHYVFSRFINGELPIVEIMQLVAPEVLQYLNRLHAESVAADPKVNNLHERCQSRIMAYMLRTGVLGNGMDYVDDEHKYSDFFRLLSTGELQLSDELLYPSDASDQPEASLVTFGTRVKTTFASGFGSPSIAA